MNRFSRFVALAALVGLPVAAQAQASQTASISTTADVLTVFAFGTASPMSFPSVIPGGTVTATGSIPFSRNTKVTYTIGAITDLTHSSGTGTLTPSITACGVGADAITIVTNFTACTSTTTLALAIPTGSALQTEYLIFKGSLTTTTSTKPGLYSGSISISAAAN